MVEPIGLYAAAGSLPVRFVERAREMGLRTVVLGVRGMADPKLESLADRFYWVGVGKMGRAIRCLTREGVRRWAMAGKFHKAEVWRPAALWHYLPDWRTLKLWWDRSRRDNRDDSLLLAIVNEFQKDGVTCVPPTDLCPELLVREGNLTRRRPTPAEEADIAFGWEMAREMGRLDVGQSVMVWQRAVLAVEAVEGTDAAIRRAGELCHKGPFVVVKVAKPQQDMRFDVPTVGPATIETMRAAGGKVLAIEAGMTIILDEADTVRLADQYGIAITARAA